MHIKLEEMTYDEVNEATLSNKVVLLPAACIEQHGHHLPVGTDIICVKSVCERAAELAPDLLLVAPTINHGYNEHNMDFPGTITLDPSHYMGYVYDICCSLAYQGFDRIIIVNGHGSNTPFLSIVARRVTLRTDAMCLLVNHWNLGVEVLKDVRESELGGMAHCGEMETSIILRTNSQLVHMDKALKEIPPLRFGKWGLEWNEILISPPLKVSYRTFHSRTSESGVSGDPTKASPDKGERIIEGEARVLVDLARHFRAREEPPRRDHRVKKVRGIYEFMSPLR